MARLAGVTGAPGSQPGPRGPGMMLEARDLEVTPPGASRPAVRGITLGVGRGEWLAIVGENGGGKTSLLLALAGLWPLSGGTLTLDGRPFGPGRRDPAARGVAVVFQDPSSQLLQPTVAEELSFAARNLNHAPVDAAAAVARWVSALGLGEDLPRDPATLSAGRQQLVLLAAALAARPGLLLCDEPTAHLDAPTRARVREAIAREVARGMAVVWATQDEAEVAAASQRFVVGRAAGAGRGPSGAGGPGASHPAGGRGRAPALVLEISSPPCADGPCVRVSAPLEIPVPAAGIAALAGPNGAGKSVALAGAAGLETSRQVTVRWMIPPAGPPIVALQYPELQIFEDLAADEVVFAAVSRGRGRGEALAAARAHLCELGMGDLLVAGRRTWTLSTGEKRLIEVVGALIAPAGLVLLDEPTAGLDRTRRGVLARLVRDRAARGPVLVASQDREWLEMTGARVFELGA